MQNNKFQITIIIPVHNEERYLSTCLKSVLKQKGVEYEVIVIDDCSTDSSPQILEEYTKRHNNIKVIKNNKNIGQGLSRNIGLENANGRYILFLDADDYLEVNALTDLTVKIDKELPDLIFFNHYLVYEDGRREEASQQSVFKQSNINDIDGLKDKLINIFHVPWNKVYKKDFLAEIRFHYPPGSYEDVFCSFKALLEANSICLLDRAIYNYRLRPGTVYGKPNRKTDSVNHDHVFQRYDELFEYLRGDKRWIKYIPHFYIKMLSQLAGVLCVRLPADSQVRHSFFDKIVQYAEKYDPGTYVYVNYRARVNRYLIKYEQMNALILLNIVYTKLISLKSAFR